MDRSRWLVTYLIGCTAGEVEAMAYKGADWHSPWFWVAAVAGPLLASLVERYRSRKQNDHWRAW